MRQSGLRRTLLDPPRNNNSGTSHTQCVTHTLYWCLTVILFEVKSQSTQTEQNGIMVVIDMEDTSA